MRLEKKKKKEDRLRTTLTDEKCTHALFARADTPPFHPFLRCTGAENDREKRDAERRTKGGRQERESRGRMGIGRLQRL